MTPFAAAAAAAEAEAVEAVEAAAAVTTESNEPFMYNRSRSMIREVDRLSVCQKENGAQKVQKREHPEYFPTPSKSTPSQNGRKVIIVPHGKT